MPGLISIKSKQKDLFSYAVVMMLNSTAGRKKNLFQQMHKLTIFLLDILFSEPSTIKTSFSLHQPTQSGSGMEEKKVFICPQVFSDGVK